jgi:hypothetical protein
LKLNKYMAMGPSGARCQEWPCWLVAGSTLLLCSSLLWEIELTFQRRQGF